MRTEHQARGQHELHVDEKVQWLIERDQDKPMMGSYRYQVLTVRRGEMEYTFVKELGSTILFPLARPLNAWLAGEYSVGEALEIANRMRENVPPDRIEPSDIVGDWQKQLEEIRLLRDHKTFSGPSITVQRR